MEPKTFETEIAGRKLRAEFGRVAGQANGATLVSYGETTLLATATMSEQLRGGIDFFPLTVEFDERFYAAGRIKGSRWIKREGRPGDEAVISGRLIDHAIRPLFPQRLRNEVQVVITVLSFDQENDPDVLGLIGSSLALLVSDIPWEGPLAAVRVAGTKDGTLIVNPTYSERAQSRFEMVTSGPKGLVNMIEVRGEEVEEEKLEQAFARSREVCDQIANFMEGVARELAAHKRNDLISPSNEEIKRRVSGLAAKELRELLRAPRLAKAAWRERLHTLKERALETIRGESSLPGTAEEANEAFEALLAELLRAQVLSEETRPDGRALNEIRRLELAVGLLPRVHGSGLFERGETQALSVLTLGAPSMEQYLETMEVVGRKHFMHHYNFPPFSTGEVKSMRGPGRREIGHGALVERALEPVLPSREAFPYTIRIVSEILSSNGSTSMAAVSASSLALMDGGVPISQPVAGISIGMISDESSGGWKLLTDIQGPEDHHGDMDFKVAGTSRGVTAIQMDVKIHGINQEQFRQALEAGKRARIEILERMRPALAEPRPELSPYAPRIIVIRIKPERIRDVIGPGGSMIHRIVAESGAAVEVEDSGEVYITAQTSEAAEKARKWIEGLTHEYELGEVAQGKVIKLLDFGAVVELPGGKEGLLHISELAPWRVERVEDVVQLGEELQVKIIRVENGRLGFSIKALRHPELAGDNTSHEGPRGYGHSRSQRESPPAGRAGRGSRPSRTRSF